MKKSRPILVILFVALLLLVGLSFLPWSEITGGKLKNFNLLSDLMPSEELPIVNAADAIDPELNALTEPKEEQPDSADVTKDTVQILPLYTVAPRKDGVVLIEDYSPAQDQLAELNRILNEAPSRNVRIAMVGDSYIEGDILAQDIRSGLQSRYGGCGVGYMAAFSSFPGFRHSVSQTASGWEEHEIRKMKNDPLRTILGTYFVAQEGAQSRFRKSVKPANADHWNRTTVALQAPSSGTVTFSGPEIENVVYEVTPSDSIRFITVERPVGDIRFKTDVPGLKLLGFWLEGNRGIVLDDISLRGNSGISHRELNAETTRQLRRQIDYDLIILEFGMNVLSATQKNYDAYGAAMVDVVKNLKSLYPNALILIMGVGDRGHKNGTELGSMPTVMALVKAQRNTARQTGSLFWDTREAMGGEGAAVKWHSDKLVNSDYVHLNHKGGKKLADLFLKSLEISMQP